MSWSFSFELLPGEEIIEDSTQRSHDVIKSAYSVFLTNKRVIFRFDGMGSYLSNAFFFPDILDAKLTTRLFFNYLILKTGRKEYLFNVPETDYWIKRILEAKEKDMFGASGLRDADAVPPEKKRLMLLDMLTVLHKNGILSQKEFGEKVHLLDTIN
ncbi:MAG: PH domain-containing protein [Nitrospirae bacterium]|nr:PH domain-containing protein [Nitrospirota bacterium]